MPVYLVADIAVTDPETYEAYKLLSPGAVAAYGGRFVVRGGNPQPVEGDWPATRIVIVEFPDRETAHRFWDGPEYAHARKVREGAAIVRSVLVDGA